MSPEMIKLVVDELFKQLELLTAKNMLYRLVVQMLHGMVNQIMPQLTRKFASMPMAAFPEPTSFVDQLIDDVFAQLELLFSKHPMVQIFIRTLHVLAEQVVPMLVTKLLTSITGGGGQTPTPTPLPAPETPSSQTVPWGPPILGAKQLS